MPKKFTTADFTGQDVKALPDQVKSMRDDEVSQSGNVAYPSKCRKAGLMRGIVHA